MGHPVIPEISKRSKWWMPKYRFLELKYFCLQYPEWKREAAELLLRPGQPKIQNGVRGQVEFSDRTGNTAVKLLALHSKIALIDKVASEIDPPLGDYILKAATEGVSFIKLKTIYEIPCERDMYYDRYRKFFYILSEFRD